ncbi:precursor of CEP14-like [Andrographis paniculata]|uniref:precursor of CEP14-like n=1 Tax=Andrographis paniculata TaxID=175694 RepID=UPI0021E906C4|nr:precursor of CEP14-like [Andrographis paniculata]
MAPKFALLLIFLAALSAVVLPANGRKLLTNGVAAAPENTAPAFDAKLYLTALPKGRVPASTPSKKTHGVPVDEKLAARHLAAVDRILRSVPSPGVGH